MTTEIQWLSRLLSVTVFIVTLATCDLLIHAVRRYLEA